MKKGTKAKEIALRFDLHFYENINSYAVFTHRDPGESIRKPRKRF